MAAPRSSLALALFAALLPAACAHTVPPPPSQSPFIFQPPDLRHTVNGDQPATPSPFLRGTAVVVSVDQTAGYAVLDFQGRRVEAYWQTETAAAQGGTIAPSDPFKPPVGLYTEPDVHTRAFDALPGDTIGFVGMRTGNSIFLQTIAVLSR